MKEFQQNSNFIQHKETLHKQSQHVYCQAAILVCLKGAQWSRSQPVESSFERGVTRSKP